MGFFQCQQRARLAGRAPARCCPTGPGLGGGKNSTLAVGFRPDVELLCAEHTKLDMRPGCRCALSTLLR